MFLKYLELEPYFGPVRGSSLALEFQGGSTDSVDCDGKVLGHQTIPNISQGRGRV